MMQNTQGSMLQSLRSVRAFMETHAERLGNVVQTRSRRKLDEAIAELEAHAMAQVEGFLDAKRFTQRQYELRRVLTQEHMRPIVRIAAAEQLPYTPNDSPLRMPKGRPTVEKLVGLAKGMGATAAKFANTFIEEGLAPDFIARLNAAAEAVLVAVGERRQSRAHRRAATTALRRKLSAARKVVNVLDSFVQTTLKEDHLLDHWNSIRRVDVVAGRAEPAASPDPSPKTSN
jgi:hypothetical protein